MRSSACSTTALTLQGTECAGAVVTGPVDAASDMGDVQFLICAGSGDSTKAHRCPIAGLGGRFGALRHRHPSRPRWCRRHVWSGRARYFLPTSP